MFIIIFLIYLLYYIFISINVLRLVLVGWVYYFLPDYIIVISSKIIWLDASIILAIKLLIAIASCWLTTYITHVVSLAKVWILIMLIINSIIRLSIRVLILIALHSPLRIVIISGWLIHILIRVYYLAISLVRRISFVILIIIQV